MNGVNPPPPHIAHAVTMSLQVLRLEAAQVEGHASVLSRIEGTERGFVEFTTESVRALARDLVSLADSADEMAAAYLESDSSAA